MVPPDTRVRLVCGLAAPETSRPRRAVRSPPRYRPRRFSSRGGAPPGHGDWSENTPWSGGFLDGDLVAEGFEATDEAALDGVLVALVEVVAAEVLVGGAVLEQVVAMTRMV